MKTYLHYFIFILLTTHSLTAQDWDSTQLNNFASITFPFKPNRMDTLGQTFFSGQDAFGLYVVSVHDVSGNPNMQVRPSKLPDIYQKHLAGALEEAKGKLISQKDFIVNGLKGLDVMYQGPAGTTLPEIRYKRVLFVNNVLFSYEVWTTKELQEFVLPSRDKFFNSFSINLADPRQFTHSDADHNYQVGYAIGRVVGFLVVAGLLVGLVFLIKFLLRKLKTKGNKV